jgi:hypothetical protein
LSLHAGIAYGRNGQASPWRIRDEAGQVFKPQPRVSLILDDVQVVADAAVAGVGLAWLPCWLMAKHAHAGELKPVLGGSDVLAPEIHAVWPQLRCLPSKTRVASDPLVWRKDVDADAKKKIADLFASYGRDQREKDVLKTLTSSGFVRSANAQLTPIRQLALADERGKIEADANLSADEKSRKLQDVERRLDELGRQTASAK